MSNHLFQLINQILQNFHNVKQNASLMDHPVENLLDKNLITKS